MWGTRNRLSEFTYNPTSVEGTLGSEEELVKTSEKTTSLHSGGWVGFLPSTYKNPVSGNTALTSWCFQGRQRCYRFEVLNGTSVLRAMPLIQTGRTQSDVNKRAQVTFHPSSKCMIMMEFELCLPPTK